MTAADKIALVAAIAAILSAIAAFGALLIAWSARKDSQKSTEAALKSAEAAEHANKLNSRQIDLATEERNLKLQKERSESCPFLNWRGSMCSPAGGYCNWDFQNLGAMVTDLKIQSDTQGISASITPTSTLLNNGQGRVVFEFEKKVGQNLALPILFTVSCSTKLGERWVKAYKMEGQRFPERVVEA